MQQRDGAREMGLVVATLAVVGRFVTDEPLWLATALTALVAAAGTASILGELRPWRWPLDRVVLPAMSAFASVGVAHLVDPVPWLALRVRGIVAGHVAWVVGLEIAAPARSMARTLARSTSARLGAFGLAFLGFAAIGGLVPAGLAGDGQPLTVAAFVATVVLDVRSAAWRAIGSRPCGRTPGRDAVVAFYQYSMILAPVGVAGASPGIAQALRAGRACAGYVPGHFPA
jgi:hypothetical protein